MLVSMNVNQYYWLCEFMEIIHQAKVYDPGIMCPSTMIRQLLFWFLTRPGLSIRQQVSGSISASVGGDWGRGCRFAAAMASLQLFKSLILNNENSFPFHKNNIKLSSNYTHLAQPHKKPVSITGRPLIIKTVTLLRPNHTPAAVIIEFTKPKSYEFYNKGFPNFEMKVKPSLFQVDPNKVDLTKEKRC